jgi:hypothetical protein
MARKKTTKRRSVTTRKRQMKGKKILFLPMPLFIFLWLCVGVLLVAWTFRAGADDIHITGKVAAPPITTPAQTTDPTDGQTFTTSPITIQGTCPANSYVEIFRNNVMSGVVNCTGGNFQLSISLVPGSNTLTPHVFNITDDEGPVGNSITINYQPPAPPIISSGSSTPSSTGQVKLAPLTLKTDFSYKGYEVGQTVNWTAEVNGGQQPYLINIDWGDGINDVMTVKKAGSFDISHKYEKDVASQTTYTIKLKATDSLAQEADLQCWLTLRLGSWYHLPPNPTPYSIHQQLAAIGTGWWWLGRFM